MSGVGDRFSVGPDEGRAAGGEAGLKVGIGGAFEFFKKRAGHPGPDRQSE
jgi:hypothetical protein